MRVVRILEERDQRVVLSFPPFRLDVTEGRLWKNGRELGLRRKPFAILYFLSQHPRHLVTHSEIVDAVWGRVAMSDSLLRTHVCDLRRVLEDDVIETVPGRGYRLLADVSEVDEERIGLAGKPFLELVRGCESPSPLPAADLASAVRASGSARWLEELSEALTTLGIKAVLLLVCDEKGEEVATLLGTALAAARDAPHAAAKARSSTLRRSSGSRR